MNNLIKRILTALFLTVLIFILFLLNCWQFSLFIFLVLLLILTLEWPNFYKPNSYKFWLTFLFYPTLPLIALIYLYCSSKILALLVFITAFSHDTGSYIVGKTLGKHKICSKISPKKTWEGFIGGYILNLTSIAIFFKLFFQNSLPLFFIILFSLITSIFALLGDLFESYLKRKAKIKDSGKILPGHGGILDRIDAILAVTIVIILLKSKLIDLVL